MITRATNLDSTRETAMLLAFDHHLIRGGKAIAQALKSEPGHVGRRAEALRSPR